MMHYLKRPTFIAQHFSSSAYGNRLYRSTTKLVDALTADDDRKCRPLETNNIITTSMEQPRTMPQAANTTITTTTMPLLEPTSSDINVEDFEISTSKIVQRTRADKTPLSFEEIPGPAILKLWEKYWRYVPLLGTQLFCSLLINKFTQGRLSWNRNITPIKYLFDRYGCVVRIRGPLVNDIVMIHRPEHIAEVFKQENESPIRSGIDILQHYRLHHRKYRSAGAFSLQDSEWLDVKRKIDRPLNETILNHLEKLDSVCGELIDKICDTRNLQDEVPEDFHRQLTAWGMECFYVSMFGRHLGFLDSTSRSVDEVTKIMNSLVNAHMYMSRCETGFQMWRVFETPFVKKLFAACDVLDEIIGKYIRQAQNKLQASSSFKPSRSAKEEKYPPFLEMMLTQRIHADDISTLLMDAIILGVQAIVNCEAFLIYFLAKNPRVQKQLHHEVTSVLPEASSSLTKDSLKNMPYLKACVKESLRLRPAFPYLTRLLPSSVTLHGYTIPKGTFVVMANQITSQREEMFEDPEKYRPERWLKEDQSAYNSHEEYSYLPFGHGPRSCLGKIMAETQMMLLAAKLVRKFTIEYDYADIQSRFLMVNVPNRPLRFRFVNRN